MLYTNVGKTENFKFMLYTIDGMIRYKVQLAYWPNSEYGHITWDILLKEWFFNKTGSSGGMRCQYMVEIAEFLMFLNEKGHEPDSGVFEFMSSLA